MIFAFCDFRRLLTASALVAGRLIISDGCDRCSAGWCHRQWGEKLLHDDDDDNDGVGGGALGSFIYFSSFLFSRKHLQLV